MLAVVTWLQLFLNLVAICLLISMLRRAWRDFKRDNGLDH